MKVRYGNCSNILCNEGGLCSFRTKSLKCLANQSNIRYYECGEHNLDEEARADEPRAHHGCTSKVKELIETIIEEARADEPRAHHGCTSKVKELIETIIFEHNIIQPKKVSKYLNIL